MGSVVIIIIIIFNPVDPPKILPMAPTQTWCRHLPEDMSVAEERRSARWLCCASAATKQLHTHKLVTETEKASGWFSKVNDFLEGTER